jgi:L-2-hydroxyglutarate oxidase LhgO
MADAALTVIGGGVVGLAVAAELAQRVAPVYVLERNTRYGLETSSRNSEVIHAGIYYPHGSLKARFCVEGKVLIYEICEKHGIPHRRITKIITATEENELQELERMQALGTANGVDLQRLSAAQVTELEPNIRTVGGLLSPSTGIVNAHGLMDYFYHTALSRGAAVQFRSEVVRLERKGGDFAVTVNEGGTPTTFTTERVVNAAGLEADTIAGLAGIDLDAAGYRLYWCRGSYFSVSGPAARSVSRLVYPVPTKHSLGVHVVLDLSGRLRFGPDVEFLEHRTQEYTVDEAKRSAFGLSARRILPEVKDEDLAPDIAGIRPKLQRQGEPSRDFVIREESDRGLPGLVNLIGIESPGLTASPAIARYVARLLT